MARTQLFLLVLIVLLVVPAVMGQEQTVAANVFLNLKDISSGNDVNEIIAFVELDNLLTGENIRYNQFVASNDILRMRLDNGKYMMTIKADNLSTHGFDYYGESEIEINESLIQGIFLFRVASLRGVVKDKLDNVVSDASLKFICNSRQGGVFPAKTDEFGFFLADAMPVGSCRVIANVGDAIGFMDVNLKHGEMKDIEVNLDRTIVTKNNNLIFYIMGIIIVVVLVYFLVIRKVRKVAEKVTEKQESEPEVEAKSQQNKAELGAKPENNTRINDILETLSKKERDIVEFLLKCGQEANQANIRHSVGIPRTTLSRCLVSLEIKKIISIKKIGKAVKVKLTPWFLGKE